MNTPADGRWRTRARLYFGAQAAAGVLWWLAVVTSEDVRHWTLGGWSPVPVAVADVPLFVGGSLLAALTGAAGWALLAAVWTSGVTIALWMYALGTGEAGWGALLMLVAAAGTIAAAAVLRYGSVPFRWFFIGPFAFRPAPPRSRAGHLVHSLAQLVVFWTAFLILLPVVVSWVEQRLRLDWAALDTPALRAAGAAVFLLGSAVGLWSCFTMALSGEGTPLPAATGRKLVVSGPYRFVRNPMALAGAAQTIGIGWVLGSWLVIGAAVAGGVIWHTLIRPEEEADLLARFGSSYQHYRHHVRCWIPTLDSHAAP